MGEALGPMFGSIFEDRYGFRNSQDIVAIFLILFMIIYFTYCGGLAMFERTELHKISP